MAAHIKIWQPSMFSVDPNIEIPEQEFELSFARSGGPGGQHVNKVSSKAILKWQVVETPSLRQDIKERFLQKFGSRISASGEILIISQRYRDQKQNIEDCFNKLKEMIEAVVSPPTPRRATKPTRSSKIKRTDSKVKRGNIKKQRRAPTDF